MITLKRVRVGRRPARARDTLVGINVALGSAVVVAAAFVSSIVPASASGVRLVPVALALAGFAAVAVDVTAAAAVTVLAYLVLDGFLVNELGELTWRGAGDVWRFLALVAAAVFGLGIGALHRWVRQRRRFAPLEAWANEGQATAEAPMTVREKEWHGA
jgi:hypothetical protein